MDRAGTTAMDTYSILCAVGYTATYNALSELVISINKSFKFILHINTTSLRT